MKKILGFLGCGGGCLSSVIIIFVVIVALVCAPVMLLGSLFSNGEPTREDYLEFISIIESPRRLMDMDKYIKPFADSKEVEIPYRLYLYAVVLLNKDMSDDKVLEEIYQLLTAEGDNPLSNAAIERLVNKINSKDVDYWTIFAILKFSTADDFEAKITANGVFNYPLKERAVVTAEFGYYEFGEHNGIDLAYPGGTEATAGKPIYSSTSGVVTFSGDNGHGGGNSVNIEFGEYTVRYLHMAQPSHLSAGDTIKAGDYIGNIGSTGKSTGAHLHFEILKNGVAQNPRNYIIFD